MTSSLRKQCFLDQSNMVRVINFRLLIAIVLCYFFVMFTFCYCGGNFHRDRPEVKSDWNIKEVSFDKDSNGEKFLEEDLWILPITNNAEQPDGNDAKKKHLISETTRKSKVGKGENFHALEVRILSNYASGNEVKTLRSSLNLKSATHVIPLMPFSSILSEEKAKNEKTATHSVILHSSKSQRRDNESANTAFSSLINEFYRQKETTETENFGLFSTRHVRTRRGRDVTSGRVARSNVCKNYITNINYNDEYKAWNNFSIKHQDRIYHFDEYRVTHDGLKLCNSSDLFIQRRWRNLTALEKQTRVFEDCNVSVDIFPPSEYILYKDFTVFFLPAAQNFTWQTYGVFHGAFVICSAKLSLSCDDFLVTVKYEDQYNVLRNFCLFYNNKMYNYDEYRIANDGLEICASNDARIQAVWKAQLYLKTEQAIQKCNGALKFINYYVVNKRLTVYWAASSQYFTRHDYAVWNNTLIICDKKLKPLSVKYTKEDMSMCSGSIISIKYDGEYRVWNNFSIVFKNKVYDYTEYRILTGRLTICNSTDSFVQNAWRLRNYLIKGHFLSKEQAIWKCNRFYLFSRYYVVNKRFTVYWVASGKYLKRYDYAVANGTLFICEKTLKLISTVYTEEDMVMCNDSIISIKYDDEYRVWNNFSIVYKNKLYVYTDYRILAGVITVCNSTDSIVQHAWKRRNDWINNRTVYEKCNTSWLYEVGSERYIVLKDFNVRIAKTGQILEKNEYGVFNGALYVCHDTLWSYVNLKYYIALLFFSSLSVVCVILLLIVYCGLPELRTLPGMNIMSLSIAFMLWDICAIGYLSLRFTRAHLNVSSLCVVEILAFVFVEFTILTNAAVNVYHLRKTFCRNVLVKSNKNGLKAFLKYALFSWGVPVILSAAEVVVLKTDLVRLTYDPIAQSCKPIRISLAWRILTYILDGCLMLYIIITFILTAYRIRQNLKAGGNIAQKSNTIKNRNSFVLLLKLSTTTGLTWFPGKFFVHANISPLVLMVILIIILLSGVYVAIAFVFTRKNYRLLKKKYFSRKENQVNK